MIDLPMLVLTGAGISAESGVPTFRGDEGLWKTYSPEDLATPEAFAANPRLVWDWYSWRRETIAGCHPNAAHHTLVEIETWIGGQGGSDRFNLVTQNVDGLHELAGSRNVRRLHGSIWWVRCPQDGTRFEDRSVPLDPSPPICPTCSGMLRPDIVWFGESLDPAVLDAARTAAENAATVIVIGTSALVYPAAALPLLALESGARVIEINPEETPLSAYAGEVLRGAAAVELPKWWESNRS